MSYDATFRIRRFFSQFAEPVDTFGEQALFYGESMRYIPNALTRYRKETIRLIAEMTMGTGALVLIGGGARGGGLFLVGPWRAGAAPRHSSLWHTGIAGLDR